jgi:hypothetical protein
MSDDVKNDKLNIELSEEMAEGQYSNLAVISHSSSEFVFDFIKIMPGMPKGKVKSRVMMTPQHAKRLLRALNDNIVKYESQLGKITEGEQPNFPMNFGGPAGEA